MVVCPHCFYKFPLHISWPLPGGKDREKGFDTGKLDRFEVI